MTVAVMQATSRCKRPPECEQVFSRKRGGRPPSDGNEPPGLPHPKAVPPSDQVNTRQRQTCRAEVLVQVRGDVRLALPPQCGRRLRVQLGLRESFCASRVQLGRRAGCHELLWRQGQRAKVSALRARLAYLWFNRVVRHPSAQVPAARRGCVTMMIARRPDGRA